MILSGTAAASVAAIASAHGVATAAPAAANGPDGCSLGNGDGALASFLKLDTAFRAFMKWGSDLGAEVFYKEAPAGGVDMFIKFWQKGRNDTMTSSLGRLQTLDGASAYFVKIDDQGASFFIKGEGVNVVTSFFIKGEKGVQMSVSEMPTDAIDRG
jgi:hypothetical protein